MSQFVVPAGDVYKMGVMVLGSKKMELQSILRDLSLALSVPLVGSDLGLVTFAMFIGLVIITVRKTSGSLFFLITYARVIYLYGVCHYDSILPIILHNSLFRFPPK